MIYLYRVHDSKSTCLNTCERVWWRKDWCVIAGGRRAAILSSWRTWPCYWYRCTASHQHADGHTCLKSNNCRLIDWMEDDLQVSGDLEFFVLNPNPTISFKAGVYTGAYKSKPPLLISESEISQGVSAVSPIKLESKKRLNPLTPDKILYTPLSGGFSCPFNISAWIRLSSWYCKSVWTVGGLCPYLYLNKYKFYPNLSDWWLENFPDRLSVWIYRSRLLENLHILHTMLKGLYK